MRDTVFLASVLFLVGISGQLFVRGGRYGLIFTGGAILIFCIVQLATLPGPPG